MSKCWNCEDRFVTIKVDVKKIYESSGDRALELMDKDGFIYFCHKCWRPANG